MLWILCVGKKQILSALKLFWLVIFKASLIKVNININMLQVTIKDFPAQTLNLTFLLKINYQVSGENYT